MKMTSKILRTRWLYSPALHTNVLAITSRCRSFGTVTNMQKHEHKTQTTVDLGDVGRHAKQKKEWWDPQGPMKALHSLNLIRVPFIRDGLVHYSPNERSTTPLKNLKMLDVGCGGGILSEALARLGANVTGIDASKDLIEMAQQHCTEDVRLANNKPNYYYTSVEEHANKYQNYYDGVVASEIIEHVNNQELFVKSCVATLKPGGRIFFTTPNRTRLSQVLGICVAEYLLNLIPRGTHQYEKFMKPTELTFLLERNNCHVEIIHGLVYSFWLNRWDWINSQALLYALQAVKMK